MPKVSIIVAAYNVGKYIRRCLESVLVQTFADFEVVVVDDASTDETSLVLKEYAENDARVRIVTHPINQGRHLARKSGVAAAQGEVCLFLDGDDELSPSLCRELVEEYDRAPVDILHFGITVLGENGLLEEERDAYERYNNAPTPPATGSEIAQLIFDPHFGQKVDWRVTTRLYPTEFLKLAFSQMTDERLERAEDGYECFVISALARSSRPFKHCRGYLYHYGRGITGTGVISPEIFARFCRQFGQCFDAAARFSRDHSYLCLERCLQGFIEKGTELLMNDWHVRLDDDAKMGVLPELVDVIGADALSVELMRFVRDDAYALWVNYGILDSGSQIEKWARSARSLREGLDRSVRYEAMRDAAERHLAAVLERTERWSEYRRQDIRIFVSTHKDVDLFESNILQPVQVGAKRATSPIGSALRDSDGDNISELNPMYCELTTQYWAWKNVDAEYYGFCHYRRYFDFSETRHKENAFGEIMWDSINIDAQREFCLDDASIASSVRGYDVITTEFKDLRKFPGGYSTPWEHYDHAPLLHIEDLELAMRILGEMHPDYVQDADEFLLGNESCFCNMFIMRKELFNEYCAWLFPILERFMDECDMSHYGREARRTPGHLAERLFNIYYRHHMRLCSGWKVKQLQCVHFEHPERIYGIEPVYSPLALPVIPVVLAADNAYVPMLATAIFSMLSNASDCFHYDVIVLGRGIAHDRREALTGFIEKSFAHATLRFVEVSSLIERYHLKTNNAHIGTETYYRFLIQGLLPFYEKVLYLDSDLIVEGDISELFSIDLGNNLLAATHDIDYLGNLNLKDGKRLRYSKDVLSLSSPYDYFQAGVLLLNICALREFCAVEDWLAAASDSEYIYDDQDILNARCQGRVHFLPYEWNVMIDCGGRVANLFSIAPAGDYDAYLASRRKPKVVHYAGVDKPWKNEQCDESVRYWSYARRTPFYEELVGIRVDRFENNRPVDSVSGIPGRAISESNPIRRVLDPLLPIGSRRRELFKAFGRIARNR